MTAVRQKQPNQVWNTDPVPAWMYEEMAEFPLPFSTTRKTAPPPALFSWDGSSVMNN